MKVVHSDILDEKEGIIVHGVNMQGKFGAGLAKQIGMRYPTVYMDYMYRFKTRKLKLGDVIETHVGKDHFFASGVTQRFYGRVPGVVYVDYNAVIDVFDKINVMAHTLDLPVKFPRIGCGLAHGNWETIAGIIEDCLDPSIERILFDPK